MLSISRRVSESIKIGPDIMITVTKVKGSRVTLGIKAKPNTLILRAELCESDDAPDCDENGDPDGNRQG